jgi:hypothetical protein
MLDMKNLNKPNKKHTGNIISGLNETQERISGFEVKAKEMLYSDNNKENSMTQLSLTLQHDPKTKLTVL